VYYLRNTNDMGYADYAFGYGAPGSTWTPIMGDWDGNRSATIGFYDQASSQWYLRNTNDMGMADVSFGFGAAGAGWLPIAGNWGAAAGTQSMAGLGQGGLPSASQQDHDDLARLIEQHASAATLSGGSLSDYLLALDALLANGLA
jgi:hypothetical protein